MIYKNTNFSLIELMVVVSIIAVLVSLLFPALRKAKESARTIQCSGNLKQIASAIAMYNTDHEGFYPMNYPVKYYSMLTEKCGYLPVSHKENLTSGGNGDRPARLPSVFICPTHFAVDPDRRLYYGGYVGSYGPNQQLFTTNVSVPYCHYSVNNIVSFSNFLIFGEAVNHYGVYPNSDWSCEPKYWGVWDISRLAQAARYKHNNKQNILLADGHVNAISYGDHNSVVINRER